MEDVSNVSFKLICPNPDGGHEFTKKGAWLEANQARFFCPVCGFPMSLNHDQLMRLFSDHVKKMEGIMDRLRGQAKD